MLLVTQVKLENCGINVNQQHPYLQTQTENISIFL